MKPDLRCYYHPEREAANQCDRCGDYLCAECVKELQEQYLCATCIKDLTRATLGKTGRIACVIVFASLFVGWAIAAISSWLVRPDQGSWTALVYGLYAISSILLPLAALILALIGRKAERPAARKVRTAVAVYSAVGVGGGLMSFVLMAVSRISGLSGSLGLMVVAVITGCLFVAGGIFAGVLLLQALRRGIQPLWPVILFAIPVVLVVAQNLVSIYLFVTFILPRFI